MGKTLYLHIGHYKTGTTALQLFLQNSGRFLRKNGFNYPDVWMRNSKHSPLVFSVLRAAGVEKQMYDFRDPTPPAQMWGDLFDTINKSTLPGTIISSEEFMRIGQFPAAEAILKQVLDMRPMGLRVCAVAYLREPDAHLRSWYNQLVKMNQQVSNLNAAVDGDIEDIHIDYRCALEPWQRLLGRENVIIRPYVRSADEPDALHRDFMAALGVSLPKGQVSPQRDPNPRFDDRALELVRLMQNLGLPRGSVHAIRSRAIAYLEAQDAQVPGRANGMAAAQARARAGLDWLASQVNCTVPVRDFAEHLMQPVPQHEVDQNLLLGFVFSEFIQLRQRFNAADLGDINERLEKLEARLKALDKQA
ncbi:sulfotransferase family protein [Thalassovita sp.]|uniref:sulfotransferase family protein n=1 Tax=Thalassovita sp. TaxID=1979401 RepID=UPI0029DE8C3F|nr:sulfotransferase family protein [Thalassovita sp.]